MKIPVIKQLVEQYSLPELIDAEESLMEENQPAIHITGDDEGEQLTHVYAAIQIKRSMTEERQDFKTALRNFTSRVRNSIN